MVKNSGQQKRARQYAAEHGITYRQAREALDAQHTQETLAALLAECGSTPLPPGQVPMRIPLGFNAEGVMQWDDDEEATPVYSGYAGLPRLTEIIGGPGTGKTTMVNRIIAHLATEDPRPQSILLFAGDREVESARKRWADWPQVEVIGRNPSKPDGRETLWGASRPDGHKVFFPHPEGVPDDWERTHRDNLMVVPIMNAERGDQVFVFDDWFTESDGSLLRFTKEALDDPERSTPADWADWRMAQVSLCKRAEWQVKPAADASFPVIAAFRPGHTSQRDESADIMHTVSQGRGFAGVFTPHDTFTQTPSGLEHADMIVVPDDEAPHAWLLGVDARRFPSSARDEAREEALAEQGFTRIGGPGADPVEVEEFVDGLRIREKTNPDAFDFDRGIVYPYMEAEPLNVAVMSEDEVVAAMKKYVADYWSIGERGTP